MRAWLTLTVLLGLSVAAPAGAQTWAEQGDAGDLPPFAQVPVGQGPITSITGSLGG
jgi:hypothetical protein